MAYFGVDLQNAKNMQKTTDILAKWVLVNLRTILLMQKRRKQKKERKKKTQNAREIARKRGIQNCHFSIGHFQKYHNTLCFSSKVLHKHCFYFLFKSQEKMETVFFKILEGRQRVLWYF